MTRPTALLVDDEPALRAFLRRELAAAWPELRVVGEAGDGDEALRLAAELEPDVLFLDVRMPGPDGLAVAERLARPCHVVFVTAHDDFAVAAFERAAADYLLKPVSRSRLERTVARLRERLGAAPDLPALLASLRAGLGPPARRLEWLQCSVRDEIELVAVDEVDLFRAADKYTVVRGRRGEWIIRTPLKELEEALDPARFWRVHRNAIVRVAAVQRVRRDLGGQLLLQLHGHDEPVPVGRSYQPRFKQM